MPHELICVRVETKKKLAQMKEGKQSFDSLINELIDIANRSENGID